MGTNKTTGLKILVWILIAIILSFIIAYVDRDKEYISQPSNIPSPPSDGQDYFYEFHTGKWRPVYSNPRANGINEHRKPNGLTEEDLQEYLEEHVDGYLEDTYWGEHYDLNDKDPD